MWRVAVHSAESSFPVSGLSSREFRSAGRDAGVAHDVTLPGLTDALVYGCVDWFMYPTPAAQTSSMPEKPDHTTHRQA